MKESITYKKLFYLDKQIKKLRKLTTDKIERRRLRDYTELINKILNSNADKLIINIEERIKAHELGE